MAGEGRQEFEISFYRHLADMDQPVSGILVYVLSLLLPEPIGRVHHASGGDPDWIPMDWPHPLRRGWLPDGGEKTIRTIGDVLGQSQFGLIVTDGHINETA